MSTEITRVFKKEDLDFYLKELAKEYKKLVGRKMPAEIILIGGAAIIENYGFRDMTTDVDAIISAASAMKDAIDLISDRYGLPNGWLNDDFQKTGSYSVKLLQFSTYYRTFDRVLSVRIVTGEYLIAMKLRAFRQFKNDISDVIGILAEHKRRGDEITGDRIDQAVSDLYGTWDVFPDGSREFIAKTLAAGDYESVYELVRKNEKDSKEQLIELDEKYPGLLNGENVNEVLRILREKKLKNDRP